MTIKKRVLVLTALAGLTLSTAVGLEAQNRKNFSIVSDDGGHVALGLAIRKLNVAGTFMQAPAHPDDETNALFATFGYVMGLRVIDVQNNRGDGGQNEIGPELFRDIGVLRTAELLAAHQIDGAEQYFTRAIDYGYSFFAGRGHSEVGPRRNHRRLRALLPLPPPRHRRHDEHPGRRRRPRA